MTAFRRFYSTSPLTHSICPREQKERERERIAQETTTFLSRGGSITPLPYGASALPYGDDALARVTRRGRNSQ